MKLIIDIGESYYKEIKENKNTNAYKYAPYKLIANGKLLQAELEEIKAEIQHERSKHSGEGKYTYTAGLKVSIDIIDNHIKELKGENNEEV